MNNEDELCDLLAEQVEEMLDEHQKANPTTPLTEHAENRLKYPLARLRVDYTGYTTTNPQKFGARFAGRVANPGSLLKFVSKPKKRREGGGASKNEGKSAREFGLGTDEDGGPDVPTQIQDLVSELLEASKEQLRLLPQSMLDVAVFDHFVGKDEKNAITKHVDAWLTSTHKDLAQQVRHPPQTGSHTQATTQSKTQTTIRLFAD